MRVALGWANGWAENVWGGRQGFGDLTLGTGVKWFKENFSSSLYRRQSPDIEMYGVVHFQFLGK